ncbi:phage tail protein [Xenorhabdus mauleonii]|nr:phage tail protein [Xenorhabdus mauleonii]
MSKLQQLTIFLRENLPECISKTEFTSEMGKISFIQAQKDLGLGQYQMFIQKYNAMMTWRNFPHKACDPRYIPLLIDAWLMEQNDTPGTSILAQERPTMTVKTSVNEGTANEETAIVMVSLPLSETVIMREDKNGIVPFDGKRWLLATPEIWFAENGILRVMDESGTPIEQIR